ncbi:MAG: hypothetical protein PHE73_09155 [Sulfurovaceae bacterium]|nr:hypothetical protein [Sulfurovaceae bacterium]
MNTKNIHYFNRYLLLGGNLSEEIEIDKSLSSIMPTIPTTIIDHYQYMQSRYSLGYILDDLTQTIGIDEERLNQNKKHQSKKKKWVFCVLENNKTHKEVIALKNRYLREKTFKRFIIKQEKPDSYIYLYSYLLTHKNFFGLNLTIIKQIIACPKCQEMGQIYTAYSYDTPIFYACKNCNSNYFPIIKNPTNTTKKHIALLRRVKLNYATTIRESHPIRQTPETRERRQSIRSRQSINGFEAIFNAALGRATRSPRSER